MIILVLMALGWALIWIEPDFLRGMHSIATMALVSAGGIAFLAWFFLRSGLDRRRRVQGAAVMLVCAAGIAASLRSDGWDGNMRPIFAWRWTLTPEQRLEATQAHRGSTTAVDLLPVPSRDYPGFLGADRRGVIPHIKLGRDWNAQPPHELWRKPIGLGWSAFAIVGDFAFTQEQRGDEEVVACYELKTSIERWTHADKVRFSEALGGDGPRATPTVHVGRVYALGATGILNCLDAATGEPLWSRNILDDAGVKNRDWGMAGSPLIVGRNVIVSPGGDKGRSLWAYSIETGEPAWHGGDDLAAYTSPLLTTLAGHEQVLILNAKSLTAHDPADGRQLWRHPWSAEQVIKCAQPVPLADFGDATGKDQVLISSGYTVGSQLVRVTQDENGGWDVQPLWSTRQLRAKFSNMLVHDGFVYGLDEGILVCLDLRDGRRRWKQGRYGHGQLLLVDDLLLIQAESGEVFLVEPTPQGPRELGRLAALTDKTWNHPALAAPISWCATTAKPPATSCR